MKTRRIEVTITWDPKNAAASAQAEELTAQAKDLLDCPLADKQVYDRTQLHDYTFQVTDILP